MALLWRVHVFYSNKSFAKLKFVFVAETFFPGCKFCNRAKYEAFQSLFIQTDNREKPILNLSKHRLK